jgi:hypothetical protein
LWSVSDEKVDLHGITCRFFGLNQRIRLDTLWRGLVVWDGNDVTE